MSKIGTREAALRKQREDDLTIPGFLKRTPGDAKTAVAPAVNEIQPARPKQRDHRIPKGMSDEEGAALVAKLDAAKQAKKEAGLAKLAEVKKKKAEEKKAIDDVKAAAKAANKPERSQVELLAALTANNQESPMTTDKTGISKKVDEARKAIKKTATAPKSAGKKKATENARTQVGRHMYDWKAAREAAEKGVLPKAPDFSAYTHRSYRGMLGDCEKLVKAKDLKGLEKFLIKGSSTSRNAVKKYRDIAITALKAKK